MYLTVEDRPALTAGDVRRCIHDLYGIDGDLTPWPAEWDQNFRLDAGKDGTFVVKIANRGRTPGELDFENAVMHRLTDTWSGARSPRVVASNSGQLITAITSPDRISYRLRVLTYLPGERLAACRPLGSETLGRIGQALGEVDCCLSNFQHEAMKRDIPWDLRRAEWISAHTHHIQDVNRRGMVERLLLQYRGRVKPLLSSLPVSVIHNDANDENILLAPAPDGGWQVSGLLDYGDMLWSNTVNELAIACAYVAFGDHDPLAAMAAVTAGYHWARPLHDDELQVLFPIICMRLGVSVVTSAIAASEDPANAHRQISDAPAWQLLERLAQINWRDAEIRFRAACGLGERPATRWGSSSWNQDELLSQRRERIGPSLSLAYDTPLVIVRGRGQYLFDPKERAYLDCVNNVCHVGHSHPRVVAAMAEQAAILNTNTRYLHPLLLEYAERLSATLPDRLSVCYFVNSGSEANELAIRMARTYTGRRDVIVVEDGYHGNTSTLVDLSPYKCEGPGGQGLADWAHKVPKPDPYRGLHQGTGGVVGNAYAEYVREVCEGLSAENRPPALFLCEPLLGCGGQIVPPQDYLRHAFEHVRSVGGLCVADEVQLGMGRVGTHWWAFETQGVVPDIVTIGKPIGNGHPLAAVITTHDIAASFDNGMEYFSTFGGNPVSVAVGMAVMDAIEEEGLREQAERVGRYLRGGFNALGKRHNQIGDVRGHGMFMGVELVLDRETRAPAPQVTRRLIESVKTAGILLSAEGPHHNVLKIKPPLPFDETDAGLLLGAVDRALTSASPNAVLRNAKCSR